VAFCIELGAFAAFPRERVIERDLTMIRTAIAVLLVAAALAGPSAAGEKQNSPKLTRETKDGAQVTQENIVKLKLKRVQPVQPNPPMPVGGPPALSPPAPPNP
jgi:hypothetical protein